MIFEIIRKIFFPERCPVCDAALPVCKKGFCEKCYRRLTFIEEPVCFMCGRLVGKNTVLCPECVHLKRNFEGGRFVFSYSQVAESIYRFKYMNRPSYARGYALETVRVLKDWIEALSPDAFIPIPLYKKRLIDRGYNQSEELAKELSKLTGVPVKADCVKRIRNTVPQKMMDRKGRQNNLKKAFIVSENVVELTTVVLIDDIFTTGSTIDSLAETLKENGVKNIFFITISAAGT